MGYNLPMADWSPLALLYIPLALLCLWPLVDRLLADSASPLLKGLTALSLSTGFVTFSLFGIGLLPGRWIVPWVGFAIPLIGLGAGLAVNPDWFAPARWRTYWQRIARRLVRFDIESLTWWAILLAVGIVIVYSLYYPFIGDDVLTRYGQQAREIYLAGHIPDGLWGYPPLVPLVYVISWFGAGGPNEHLARLVIAIMAIGALAATYVLGRQVLGRRGGLVAAALLAFTPMFIDNATLAYTDLPTTLPLTLAVVFAVRWWQSGSKVDALLAGLLTGVAIFTKQSGLLWLPSLLVVSVGWLIAARQQEHHARWRRMLAGLIWMLLPAVLIGTPWYVRNALTKGWGQAIPIAGEFHLAAPGVGIPGILPPIVEPASFGWIPSLFYAIGWITGFAIVGREVWQALQGKTGDIPRDLLLSAFILPYWLAWWTRFSFATRFLLLILPITAVWGARIVLWLAEQLARRDHFPDKPLRFAAGLSLVGLSIWGAQNRLGGVYQAFTQPFVSDRVRLQHAKHDLIDIVSYVEEHFVPGRDRIWLMDSRMAYYLADYDPTVGFPINLAQLEGYDYIVHISSIYTIYGNGRLGWEDSEFYRYAFDERVFEPVYVSNGVHVMKILRTTPPPETGDD